MSRRCCWTGSGRPNGWRRRCRAVQLHDLAAFNTGYLQGSGAGDGDTASAHGPVDGLRDPRLPAACRMAVVEVACELQVAQVTAGCRISDAVRAVEDHPDLVDLVGTGRVSMAGLRRVLDTTVVLDPDRQHTVDSRARIRGGPTGADPR